MPPFLPLLSSDSSDVVSIEMQEELFACGICQDVVCEPTTLTCCGRSFCRTCLRSCMVSKAQVEAMPICPGGCGAKLPYRLPPVSRMIDEFVAATWKKRQQERLEELKQASEAEEAFPGGFRPWQEVAAALDLLIGSNVVAAFGTRGIVVTRDIVPGRITVKFDELLDGRERCLHVQPREIVAQLPTRLGVSIGQRVYATADLMFGEAVGVRHGVQGSVLGRHMSDRLTVLFDERVDGQSLPVNVLPGEVKPWKIFAGGFLVGQEVKAKSDLICGGAVLVRKGVRGVVWSEYSDTRLCVQFDRREDGDASLVNVTPGEIVGARADGAGRRASKTGDDADIEDTAHVRFAEHKKVSRHISVDLIPCKDASKLVYSGLLLAVMYRLVRDKLFNV
eukprot:TRINITY_DN83585_c0_g1_i1.p1 TRINITY_DN83585_c0_g1~~TRINITY_DN83585_c0_g1_i1.p1  ORF type:complete len:392 (-),score=79.62 TRINITY_DN83585_c0_g1_i1:183-1358(-)